MTLLETMMTVLPSVFPLQSLRNVVWPPMFNKKSGTVIQKCPTETVSAEKYSDNHSSVSSSLEERGRYSKTVH